MLRKKFRLNGLILLTFLLGVIIAFQVRNVSSNSGTVKFKSINELKTQIEVEKTEIGNLSQLVFQKNMELDNYNRELEATGSIVTSMEEEKRKRMLLAGVSSVKGNGISIKLSDSKKELKEGENPNDKIVHDQDILHILNDLRINGAEAIAINSQRISSLSEVKCNGPTITINERTYGQPFIIKAIGNQENLSQAIKDPESYSYLLKTVYGLEIEVSTHENMVIPGYSGAINLIYMKEANK